MKNKFPVDIFSVKEYGIDRWQKEFSWPVSDEDYVTLCRDIEEMLITKINAYPEDISDLLLVLSSLRSEFWHFIHAVDVFNRLSEKNTEMLYSEKTLWYKDVAPAMPIDINAVMDNNAAIKFNAPVSPKTRLYKLLNSVRLNKNIFKLIGSEGNGTAEVYMYSSLLARKYIKSLPYNLRFTLQQDWLPKSTSCSLPHRLIEAIDHLSKDIKDELITIVEKNRINLSGVYIDHLERMTKYMLTRAAEMITLAQEGIRGKRRTLLFVPGFADFFSRALYLVFRKQGGKVISFVHGGNVALYDAPTFGFSEFAFSDEFITYVWNNNSYFEKIRDSNPVLKNNKTTFKSCDSDQFSKVWLKNRIHPIPQKIKRILIVGYPYAPWRRYHVAGGFWPMRLDLELRVADALKKAGYYVIYKPHPDRIDEARGIFDGRVDKVLYDGYFEGSMNAADAFLFGSIRTTAFPFALCTNKPVIAFKMDKESFKPFTEPMGLLEKRCIFIGARFDGRNRIVFDERELLGALDSAPEAPNTEFIERYMIPNKI